MERPASQDSESLNDLVQECAERWPEHGPGVLDELCAAHPRHAAALRRRIALLQRSGLLEPVAPRLQSRLGDFCLLDQLGAGGMGVVYRAEQISLRREVALKVIRPDHSFFADSRQRFLREVNAIARLQHDGIVPVYLAGEDGGVLYYAMELVRGCTLARALADLRGRDPSMLAGSDLAAAVARHVRPGADPPDPAGFGTTWVECCLRLVQQVAEALEHAHGRGVLHRDVKPSNIMLTPAGRVRLLDFGLASTEGDPRITRSGAQIGSLAYMAPEQLRGDADQIGRPTDIYGAGLVLYELLGLQQPFLRGQSEQTRQAVLGSQPGSLRARNRALSADAELVCFKAIDPDPARRYPSARDLARDLGNVLELRPIEARPPGLLLRARRAAQRRPARALSIAFAGLLLLGVFPALWLQQRAARLRLQEEKGRTEAALVEAKDALARAELQERRARFGLSKAREAVDRFLADIGEFRAVDIPLLEELRHDLLQQAAALYEQLLHDPQGDPDPVLAFEHARTLFSLGQVLRDLDRNTEALGVLQRAVDAMHGRQVGDDPEETRRLRAVAQSALGSTHWRLGQLDAAEKELTQADAEFRALAAGPVDARLPPAHLTNTVFLAHLRHEQQRPAEATALFQEAMRLAAGLEHGVESMRVLAGARRGLGLLLGAQSEPRAAIEQLELAVDLRRQIVQRAPTSARFRRDLVSELEGMGTQLQAWFKRREPDALQCFAEAAELATSLVRDFPQHPDYRVEYCRTRLQTARLRALLGQPGDAERDFAEAIAGLEQVRAELPREQSWRLPLGFARYTLAMFHRAQGNESAADAELARGQQLLDELMAASPQDPTLLQQQAELLLACSGSAALPPDEALALARRAFAIGLGFLPAQRADAGRYGTAYRCFERLADLLCARGAIRDALAVADTYRGAGPYKWMCQLTLARTYLRCHAALAGGDDAAAERERCLAEARRAVQRAAEHSLPAVLRIEDDPVFAPVRDAAEVASVLVRARAAKQ